MKNTKLNTATTSFKVGRYYNALLGKNIVTLSIGQCGHAGYIELQIELYGGYIFINCTDGYKFLAPPKQCNSIGSALNYIRSFKRKALIRYNNNKAA